MRNRSQKIDPGALTPITADMLGAYWHVREKHRDHVKFLEKDSDGYAISKTEKFTLTNDLATVKKAPPNNSSDSLPEKSKKAKKEKFRVLSNEELGHGVHGSVRAAIGAGKYSNGKIKNKKEFNSYKWVAKIQSIEDAEDESRILQHTGHLQASLPTLFGKNLAIFFMRRAPGVTLEKWLKQYRKNKPLTARRAALICNHIIRAYIEQIYQPGVVHGDLHAGNIMISTKNPRSPIVTVIDVGSGYLISDNIEETSLDILRLGSAIELYFPELKNIGFLLKRMQQENPNKRPDIQTVAETFAQLLNEEVQPESAEEKEFTDDLFLRIKKLHTKTRWFDSVQIDTYKLQANTANILLHYYDYAIGLMSFNEFKAECLALAQDGLKKSFLSSTAPTAETKLFYEYVVETCMNQPKNAYSLGM